MTESLTNKISMLEKELQDRQIKATKEIEQITSELQSKRELLAKINLYKRQINNIENVKNEILMGQRLSYWDSKATHRKYSEYGQERDRKGNWYTEYQGGWTELNATIGQIDNNLLAELLDNHKNMLLEKLQQAINSASI